MRSKCSIAAVSLTVVMAGILCGPAFAGALTLEISTPLDTLRVGVPVDLKIVLRNDGPATISAMREPRRNQGELLYQLSVTKVDGTRAAKTAYGTALENNGWAGRTHDQIVTPGETKEDHITVSNVFEMTTPGTYTIQVIGGGGVRHSLSKTTSNFITVTVKSASNGDFNANGVVDLEDAAIIDGALNTPANKDPLTGRVDDARDLNGDGIIDVNDVHILTTLCTYPHCASHP